MIKGAKINMLSEGTQLASSKVANTDSWTNHADYTRCLSNSEFCLGMAEHNCCKDSSLTGPKKTEYNSADYNLENSASPERAK